MVRMLDRLKHNAITTRDYWLFIVILVCWAYDVYFYLEEFVKTKDLYDFVVRLCLDSVILALALTLSHWAKWIVTFLFVGGAVDIVLESLTSTTDWRRQLIIIVLWGVLCFMLWRRHLRQVRQESND